MLALFNGTESSAQDRHLLTVLLLAEHIKEIISSAPSLEKVTGCLRRSNHSVCRYRPFLEIELAAGGHHWLEIIRRPCLENESPRVLHAGPGRRCRLHCTALRCALPARGARHLHGWLGQPPAQAAHRGLLGGGQGGERRYAVRCSMLMLSYHCLCE